MSRGEIWWAELPPPVGSGPGYRHPVLVVQDNDFNRSAIATVIVVVLTSNPDLAAAPGNVELPRRGTGLSRNSVVNVSQILTLDRSLLTKHIGQVPGAGLARVEAGLRLVLGL